MSLDNVRFTIKKLLDLADSSEFDGEINNAIKFARQLMIQHGIDESELRTEEDIDNELHDFVRKKLYSEYGKMKNWEHTLLQAVCKLVGPVQYYYMSPESKKNKIGLFSFDKKGKIKIAVPIYLYGPRKYVDLAEESYKDIKTILLSVGVLRYGNVYQGLGRNYAEGFASGVHGQIKKTDEKLITELKQSNSTALVKVEQNQSLIKQSKKDAKNWLKEEIGVELSSSTSLTKNAKFNFEAFNQGMKDGARVEISKSSQKRLNNG